jgi:16S rRNA (guanine966-N2)-methyltransferase
MRSRATHSAASRGSTGGKAGARSGSRPNSSAGSRGQLRIIGGRFRGRRLPVLRQAGLRPTGDRTRETLFNWLAPIVEGSRCLDCFAGAGALGFEAASRGASQVSMIERADVVARQLVDNAELLGATAVQVITADALGWLSDQPAQAFDIVFLDPPFALGMLADACELLDRRGWVMAGSRVYLETDAGAGLPPLPPRWALVRDKRAGQVRYGLAEVGSGSDGEQLLGR